jgi:hypothetical protein
MATDRAALSLFSSAIFCASITSPVTKSPSGRTHQARTALPSCPSCSMFTWVPRCILKRVNVSLPTTSKYPFSSKHRLCSGDSHSIRSANPRASRSVRLIWHLSRCRRSPKQIAIEPLTNRLTRNVVRANDQASGSNRSTRRLGGGKRASLLPCRRMSE